MPRKRSRLAELPTHLPTIMLPRWQKKLGKRLPPVESRKPITKEEWDAARGEGSMLLRHELAGQIDSKRLRIFEKYPGQANEALKRFGGNRAKALTFLWLNSIENGRKALEECKGDVSRARALLNIRENNVSIINFSVAAREEALKKYPDPIKAANYLELLDELDSWSLDVRSAFSGYPSNLGREAGSKYVDGRQKIAAQIIDDFRARLAKYKDPRRALLVFRELNRPWVNDPETQKSNLDRAEAAIRGLSLPRLANRQIRKNLSEMADHATAVSNTKRIKQYGPYAGTLEESHRAEFEGALRSAPSRLTDRVLLRQLRSKRRKSAG